MALQGEMESTDQLPGEDRFTVARALLLCNDLEMGKVNEGAKGGWVEVGSNRL